MVRILSICVLLCLVGLLLTITVLVRPAVLEPLLVVQPTASTADALVVMAGSRSQRLPAAAQLYHQGAAPRILLTNDGTFSSWSEKYRRNLYNVEWAREYLLEEGVPAEAIVMLDYSQSGSYFDALNTREYVVDAESIGSLLVVTSDYHTRRTLWTFHRVFAGTGVSIDVFPVPRDPNYRGRYLRVNMTELVKLLYYWVWYGVIQRPDNLQE